MKSLLAACSFLLPGILPALICCALVLQADRRCCLFAFLDGFAVLEIDGGEVFFIDGRIDDAVRADSRALRNGRILADDGQT